MQLSKLALYGILAQLATAAPFRHAHHEHAKREAEAKVIYVTETVQTTVIITAGATQALGDVYTASSTTSSSSSSSITPIAVSTSEADNLLVAYTVFAGLDGEISTTSSSEYIEPTTTEAAATTPTTTSTTPTTTSTTPTTTSTTPTTTSTTPTTTSTTPTTTSTTSSSTTEEAAATTSASSTSSDFDSAILAEHNIKRALHGVDDLSWDSTLASYAQAYADKYDCSGTLTHSGGKYGENLALGYTTTGSVDAWYSEGDDYSYGSGCSVYDHFTQVVWASTTKVGCGYKYCSSYWGTYIVCSYDPAGNVVGECDANVLEG